jgi:hypothetical protein
LRTARILIGGLVLLALATGTLSDVPVPISSRRIGDFDVLAADFHVHSFPFTWSTLSPFDTVIEARRQGLDVIAMTPHNQTWVAKLGAWFSRQIDGPIVLVGEEIASISYHLIAVGITETVSSQLPAAHAIAEVHRQGGVAIAAHPYEPFWPAYDAEALRTLDGSELVRPDAHHNDENARQLRQFFMRGTFAAIGSSDHHGLGPLGYTRTYVFARERSEQGVLEAIRSRRTVVYDRGRPDGDPTMIQLVAESGGLPHAVPEWPSRQPAKMMSAIAALTALIASVLVMRYD